MMLLDKFDDVATCGTLPYALGSKPSQNSYLIVANPRGRRRVFRKLSNVFHESAAGIVFAVRRCMIRNPSRRRPSQLKERMDRAFNAVDKRWTA